MRERAVRPSLTRHRPDPTRPPTKDNRVVHLVIHTAPSGGRGISIHARATHRAAEVEPRRIVIIIKNIVTAAALTRSRFLPNSALPVTHTHTHIPTHTARGGRRRVHERLVFCDSAEG